MRGCQKGLIRDIVGGGEYKPFDQKGLIRDIVGGVEYESLSEGVDQGYSWGR